MLRDCRRRVRWFSNFVVIRRISGRGRENITAGPERERGERDRRNRGRYCALEIPCFPINHVETRSITWNSSVPAIFWRLPSVSSYGQCDRAAESKSLLKGGVSGVPFRKRKKKEKERRKRKNREREKKKEKKKGEEKKRMTEWLKVVHFTTSTCYSWPDWILPLFSCSSSRYCSKDTHTRV